MPSINLKMPLSQLSGLYDYDYVKEGYRIQVSEKNSRNIFGIEFNSSNKMQNVILFLLLFYKNAQRKLSWPATVVLSHDHDPDLESRQIIYYLKRGGTLHICTPLEPHTYIHSD